MGGPVSKPYSGGPQVVHNLSTDARIRCWRSFTGQGRGCHELSLPGSVDRPRASNASFDDLCVSALNPAIAPLHRPGGGRMSNRSAQEAIDDVIRDLDLVVFRLERPFTGGETQ